MSIQQVDHRNPDGSVFGVSATDLIGFYGATPVAQQASATQTVTTPPANTGILLSIQSLSTVAPSSVAASTCAAQALTVTYSPTATSDYIIYNKITAQAGIGIGNVRGGTTANTVVVNYVNASTGAVTPTTEAQTWAAIRFAGATGTVTLTPTPVAADTTVEQIFTVTGISPTAIVHVTKPTDQAGLGIAGFRAAGNNSLAITFVNPTAATITPTAGEVYTYFQVPAPGWSSSDSIVILGANVGSPAAVNQSTCVEQAITVTGGPLVSDFALSVSKPTAQANLGIAGVRVSAAGVLGITYIAGATTTPTANEIYIVPLFRQAGTPLAAVYPVTFTPAAVAANTTAEQALTVTGVAASSIVWVNKPTTTQGIGIVGYRTSAANVLGITFCNVSASAITPPAETYLVGALQAPPSAGSYIIRSINLTTSPMAVNLRNSLTALGLIAGA
jgi:hypothetical protein